MRVLSAPEIAEENQSPLFRTVGRRNQTLTSRPLGSRNALDMIKRRAQAVRLSDTICNHAFRATGITAYLEGGGTIEKAQQLANHESPENYEALLPYQ
jgi:integrase